MSEIRMEERISIRDSARALKKYGSTINNVKRQETYIKHEVTSNDTLQGLALKYGVTTEQIRRANRLWANDSLFLRKSLLIPVPSESLSSPSELLFLEPEQSHRINDNNNSVNNSDQSYNDFLVKIDCSIATMKSQVMMSQDNSQFVNNDCTYTKRKGAMSRLKRQQMSNGSSEETLGAAFGGSDTSVEVPFVMTQGRKVRNSLQRLEREQDEMFEL